MHFWPQNGQNGQSKNFLRHNTAIRWSKAIDPRFWPSFRQIRCAVSKKMSKNLIFVAKMAKFWTKRVKNGPDFLSEQKFLLTILK